MILATNTTRFYLIAVPNLLTYLVLWLTQIHYNITQTVCKFILLTMNEFLIKHCWCSTKILLMLYVYNLFYKSILDHRTNTI